MMPQAIFRRVADNSARSWHFELSPLQALTILNLIHGVFGRRKIGHILDSATQERVELNRGGTMTYYAPAGRTPSSMRLYRDDVRAEMERILDEHGVRWD